MQLLLMMIVILYLAIWSGVSLPHMLRKRSLASNQFTNEFTCSMEFAEFQTTLMSLEAVAVFYAIRLCLLTKDLPDAVNEAKNIAVNIFVMSLICAIVLPVNYLLQLPEVTKELMIGVAFFICTLSTITFLFGPKAYTVLNGLDIEKLNDKLKAKPQFFQTGGARVAAENNTSGLGSISEVIVHTNQLFKSLNSDDRIRLCHDQLALWQRQLVDLANKSGSTSHDNSQSRGSKTSSYLEKESMLEPGLLTNDNEPTSLTNDTTMTTLEP